MATFKEKRAAKLAERAQAQILKTQPPSQDPGITAEISFHHYGGNRDKDITFLAILDRFTCDRTISKLDYMRDYYPQEEMEIYDEANRIYMKCNSITIDEASGTLMKADILVYSKMHTMFELRQVVENIVNLYKVNRDNDLRNTRYFFDQQPIQIHWAAEDEYGNKNIDYSNMPKEFTYKKFPMSTNRTLDNIYGDKIELVKRRVAHFSQVEWFQRTGAARTLGFLLAGPPGCGKTMLIQAIAGELDRHVFNIRLNAGISASQLRNLFMQETITVEDPFNDRKRSTITVPFDQRLYVFEEVDISCDFLRRPVDRPPARAVIAEGRHRGGDDIDESSSSSSAAASAAAVTMTEKKSGRRLDLRSFNSQEMLRSDDGRPTRGSGADRDGEHKFKRPTYTASNVVPTNPEKPKLSDFLTLLDGVYETTGRIAIMTTNHPELLDPALIRSGRFEYIQLEKFTYTETKRMFMGMYDMCSDIDPHTGELHEAFTLLAEIPDGTWSPAEIGSAINTHFDDPMNAAQQLYDEWRLREAEELAR